MLGLFAFELNLNGKIRYNNNNYYKQLSVFDFVNLNYLTRFNWFYSRSRMQAQTKVANKFIHDLDRDLLLLSTQIKQFTSFDLVLESYFISSLSTVLLFRLW